MKHRGFTLIELLITIVIIGTLSMIGLFTFQGSQQRSRDARRKQDMAQIAKALEFWMNDTTTGYYPNSSSGQIVGCGSDGASVCPWGSAWVKGTGATATVYMQKLPTDPLGGYTYFYERSGKGYVIYAYLERTDDPERITITPAKSCGASNCTYKYRSSNLYVTPTP